MDILEIIIALLIFRYSPGFKKFKKDILDNKHIIKKGLGWYFKLTGYLAYGFFMLIGFWFTVTLTEKQKPFYMALLIFILFWVAAECYKRLFTKQSKQFLLA